MPCNYVRKTERGSWTPEVLKSALNACKNGMSLRIAATTFNIPRSTLAARVKLSYAHDALPIRPPRFGRKPMLGFEKEAELEHMILEFESRGLGLTKDDLCCLAYEFAERNNIKHDFNKDTCKAGRFWIEGFLKRHSRIVPRKAEGSSKERARRVYREVVGQYFARLGAVMDREGLHQHSERVYNVDKTGMPMCNRPGTVLAKKGKRIMADKKTSLEVIKSEIKEEPQSPEEPYKTYIVKEEDLEDDWTENDAQEVSEEQQSSERTEKSVVEEDHLKEGQHGEEIQRRFHTDSVQEADSEDGWTEDDDAKETEAQQSKEADHQTLTYFIKEEPADSDSADDDDERTALQATSPSCSKQGGRHLPEDFPLQAYLGTQSGSSERGSCTSEYDSCLIPSQVAYFQEKRAGDRETLDATGSYHKPGGMDKDRNEDIEMEYDEMINQSSQLCATGSDQNDPSCSLAEEKPFLCCVCSKGFTLRTSLSRHMRIHGGEKPHECTFCSKRFLYGNGLKRHLRIHTGEKPYRCTVCDKGFNESSHLTQHMTVHTGEKPYGCKFCDKIYARRTSLDVHMKTHTGDKPYQCMYCDVRFSRVDTLSRHIRSHTGEKPYECSFCNKTFSQTAHLTRHIKIHTGERPFECSICSKTFAERGHLTDHQKIHTGEKPYLCSVCEKRWEFKYAGHQSKYEKHPGNVR
eukprot:XP_011679016.1 PREDICTED: zinc finger protein 436 isoform X4 [Strongylocentrotus purpuratus]